MNLNHFIGVWLPAKAKCLFDDCKPNFVNLLQKNGDAYQIVLGQTADFDEKEYEQFFVLEMPYIPSEGAKEKESEENPDVPKETK